MSIKSHLQKLSFRTGVIVLLMCIPFYILSLVRVFFPVSTATKGIPPTVFFGLAKSFQYGGIAILGKEGYKRMKGYLKRKKQLDDKIMKNDSNRTHRYCLDFFSNLEILSGVRLIIFDLDGTLGDSQKFITDTMFTAIGRLSLPMKSREECVRVIGLPLKECLSSIISMSNEQAEECAKVYSEIFNERNAPGVVKTLLGAVKTLERLSSQGILMSIASSRSHGTLAKLMDELDLSKYITYLIAADDVAEKKPAAESVLKTLRHFNIEAHETLVVGDTEFDTPVGRNAGTYTCGATYGNDSKESLDAVKVEWIVC